METILVVAVLALVVFMAVRSFVRTLTGKNPGCGCGEGCAGCTGEDPAAEDPGQRAARRLGRRDR